MPDIIDFIIWGIVAIITVGGLFAMQDNKAILKFILWFTCSLVISYWTLLLLGPDITTAIIISVTIAFLGVKDG